jgi:protein polybromo-1
MSRRKRHPVGPEDFFDSLEEEISSSVKLKKRKVEKPTKKRPLLAKRAEVLSLEVELLHSLYDAVRNHKEEETGRLLCASFLRIPNKKSFPEYYDAIECPVDLSRIQYNLKVGKYSSVAAFLGDFDLLLKNAKFFYLTSSKEYKDACALEDFLHLQLDNLECLSEVEKKHMKKKDLISSPSSAVSPVVPSTDHVDLQSPQRSTRRTRLQAAEPVLSPMSSQSEDDSKTLSSTRHRRHHRQSNQSEHPGSASKYSLDVSIDDIQLEDDNNGEVVPSSQVGSAEGRSRRKRNVVKIEEETPLTRKKTSKQTPVSNAAPSSPHSSDKGALSGSLKVKIALSSSVKSGRHKEKRVSTEPTAEERGQQTPKVSNKLTKALIKVYDTVLEKEDLEGRILSEIFMTKPSRKLYPAYYLAITRPIDLTEIKANIATNKYSTMSEFLEEINLLFKNAQTFNEEGSLIYHDSVTLGNVVCHKLRSMWKTKPPTSEDLSDLLLKMTTAAPPVEFTIPGRKGEYVLSSKMHDYLGLTRGDLFRWFPEMKIATTAEERKDISKRGLCKHSMLALRVIPAGEVKSFVELKQEGYTGKELVRTLIPKVPRSTPKVTEGDPMETTDDAPVSSDTLKAEQATMKDLLAAIYQAKGPSGRAFSTTFHQVPQKWAKADHYYSGKRLIDLQLISERMALNHYHKSEEMFQDLQFMCHAVCKLTPHGSAHYYDAVLLHNFVLQKKRSLLKEGQSASTPNAKLKVQRLLRKLLKSTLEVKSTGGSSPAERIQELKVPEESNREQEEEILELKTIIANVERGDYHRLDRMQDDLLGLLDYIRRSTHPGCQANQDAVELTRAYLSYRDKLCENGERLHTPAISRVTQSDFELDVQVSLKAGQPDGETPQDPDRKTPRDPDGETPGDPDREPDKESKMTDRSLKVDLTDAEKTRNPSTAESSIDLLSDDGGDDEKRTYMEEVESKGHTYHIGDYVYVKARHPNKPCHIVMIVKIWKSEDSNDYWFCGTWFFRPEETFHVATRKFYEKELFKTELDHMVRLSHVRGKCYVMFVKDYVKSVPEGFDQDDVFVCESRYIRKMRVFKKYKTWSVQGSHHPTFVKRSELFTIPRVPSVFLKTKEDETGTESFQQETGSGQIQQEIESDLNMPTTSTHKEIDSVQDDSKIVVDVSDEEDSRAEVVIGKDDEFVDYDWENMQVKDLVPEPGCTYYEQFVIDRNRFRIGDFVFVRSDEPTPYIARIDRMWTDNQSDPWFSGPWFVRPDEVEHVPTKMFYRNEVFMSSIQDTNPMRSVIGRCAVLVPKDFVKWRPTEVFEDDVFVCERKYNESEKEIKKIRTLKTYTHSSYVIPDEVYYFKEEIPLVKVPSPKLMKVVNSYILGVPSSEEWSTNSSKPPPPQPLKKTVAEAITTLVPPASPLATPVTIGTVTNPILSNSSAEQPAVPMAISLMAEEVQKQMKQKSIDMPIDVVTRVVTAEWPKMTDQQRLPYERKALILKCASKMSGIPGVIPTTSSNQMGLSQQLGGVSVSVLNTVMG